MPVSLEHITRPSEQDLVDLEKLYLDYPTEQRLSDVHNAVSSNEHCQLFAARFNDRLLGALTLTTNAATNTATINHLCVRAITRKRHVGRDLLRLLIAKHPQVNLQLDNCIGDNPALDALMQQASFSKQNNCYQLKR